MTKRTFVFAVILIICASFCLAQEKRPSVIAIKSTNIIPVVGEDIVEGTILIKDGLIEAVGKNIDIPQGAKIINAKGLFAYPGMIDGLCYLGLQEISSIRATVDYRETGRFNPQAKTVEALRPDSMHIPISRSNGITAALVAPSAGLISGLESRLLNRLQN
jgi:imidazolonepropionase-like amidohydrolase